MKGALQLVGLWNILGGFALALLEVLNVPVGTSPNWILVAAYSLFGLVAGVVPLGPAEFLERLEVLQSASKNPRLQV